jgi:hypothetical protein
MTRPGLLRSKAERSASVGKATGESVSPSQLLGVISISVGIVTLAVLGRGSSLH